MFIKEYNLFLYLGSWIDNLFNFSIRNSLMDFIDNSYDPSTASFIKLILFNVKEEEIYDFYNKAINISIVHFICISGFHLNIIVKIINFLFKKIKPVGHIVSISTILFYSYLLNFSFSSLRVLIMTINKLWFSKTSKDKMDGLCLSAFILLFISPSAFDSYSFMMSYLGTMAVIMTINLELNNVFFEKLLINFAATLINLPFVLQMNQHISLFAIINSFVFGYVFSFTYIYFLFFSWMPFLVVIHKFIIDFIYLMIGSYEYGSIMIYLKPFPDYATSLYYLSYFGFYQIIKYLIVNKYYENFETNKKIKK